jgi:nitrilase
VDGPEMDRLIHIAKSNSVYLCVGFTEKQESNGSLYCSMVYISPTYGLLGVHRKIKPTGTERLIWAEADGATLTTFNTRIGKLGGLICWENYMPLARMAIYQKGVEIYLAPTADSRTTWTYTMQHIALEGRCFVLGCNQYYTKSMYPEAFKDQVANEPEKLCEGGSIIVSPLGEIIAGPLFGKSGSLIAELDLDEVQDSKLDFDVVGHYARNDIFKLDIQDQPDIFREE